MEISMYHSDYGEYVWQSPEALSLLVVFKIAMILSEENQILVRFCNDVQGPAF
jgi:hypothetical protein